MTPDELQAIRDRANNATPGPWTRDELCGDICGPNGEELFYGADVDGTVWASELDDAIFATHARTDIPDLLDHVDEVNESANDFAQAATSLSADNVRLGDRLEAVRELHQPRPNSASALYPEPLCTCGKEYPCDTAQAIGGTN